MKIVRLLLPILIAFLLVCESSAQSKSYSLNDAAGINYKEISKNDPAPDFKNAKRFRELIINPVIQKNELIRINDTILLDLFYDKHYKAYIDKMDVDVNGTLAIRARFTDFSYAYCIISTSDGKSFITIEVPENNELFMSGYDHLTNKYYLLEIDKSKQDYLEGSPSLIPPVDNKLNKNPKKKDQEYSQDSGININPVINNEDNTIGSVLSEDKNTPVTISVLIVYTNAASAWAIVNETSINNTISSLIARSQLALDNSNTQLTIKLMHSELVKYTELNSVDDLYNLRNTGDGFMDNIHSLRNTYCADLVVLLEDISYTGGQGFLLNSISGDPTYAFSLTRVQQASWTYTTIHEIGHNLGCHHHKLQNEHPGPGLFSYSAGWRWTGAGNIIYCSVMTYESGTYFEDKVDAIKVPYFSNPDIKYLDFATGNVTEADNARTIRQTGSVAAAYRDDCSSAPAAPIIKDATNILHTSFTADWSASETATSYHLDVARDEAFILTVTGFDDKDVGDVTSFNVTGLNIETRYYYRVRAFNICGTSANSNTICVMTLPNAPSAPSAKNPTNIVQTSFTANWNSTASATGYRLDVATDADFTSFATGFYYIDAGNVTSYNVTGLNAKTQYYYRVRAYNSGGTSSPSETITVKTLTNPSSVPSGMTAISCNNLVFLKWGKSNGPDFLRYRVYSGTSNNPVIKTDSTINGISDTLRIISGLTRGQTYFFRVTAVNNDGVESDFSSQSSTIVKTGVIPKIRAKWGDVLICSNLGDSIKSYQWYKYDYQILNAINQYYVTNKKSGTYKVETIDRDGCKNTSNSITVSGTKSISVYPNPASLSFSLNLNEDSEKGAVISLFKSTGIKVMEFRVKNMNDELLKDITVDNLDEGIYIVQVLLDSEDPYYTKIVVIK